MSNPPASRRSIRGIARNCCRFEVLVHRAEIVTLNPGDFVDVVGLSFAQGERKYGATLLPSYYSALNLSNG